MAVCFSKQPPVRGSSVPDIRERYAAPEIRPDYYCRQLRRLFGTPSDIEYSVAKAALHHFSRCLAAQLRSENVSVNCVVPGNILSERFMREHKITERKGIDLTLDRFGTPEEVARVVLFLATVESFVSGQVIRVDGGKHTFPS
jgi:NAD(P)-dependent dehydrogenase (short-subunit alcohol dehydrogenase family)